MCFDYLHFSFRDCGFAYWDQTQPRLDIRSLDSDQKFQNDDCLDSLAVGDDDTDKKLSTYVLICLLPVNYLGVFSIYLL